METENHNHNTMEIKEPETKINIGEVYFDKELENVLDKKEFASEVQKMNREIEDYLGENKNSSRYDFRIYSDRKEYEDYLETNFPEKPKENYMDNDVVFYYDEKSNTNVIAKFMKLEIDPNDSNVQKYLEKTKITFDELKTQVKQNYKNNIYPTIAHELTHSHSFFKGVNYKKPGNKWAQEMVSVFIDQKMWEKYIVDFRKKIETKVKEQVKDKDLYNEIVKDFNEGDFRINEWERLFYPFLENRYGKEKLRNFWSILSEQKKEADLEQCFETSFGEKLNLTMSLFQEEIMREKE